MTQENHFASASIDSHSAPEPGNIQDRVETLRQNVRKLSETLDAVDKNLQEAAARPKSDRSREPAADSTS
jgi:hypothetical protein